MGRDTRMLLYAGLFLALTESVLALSDFAMRARDVEPASPPPSPSAIQCPVVFLTGTSRTMSGLAPRTIERELAEAGLDCVWVANVSQLGVSNVGMLFVYQNEHSKVMRSAAASPGYVGIEVRCAAMNDAFLLDWERAQIARKRIRPIKDGLGQSNPTTKQGNQAGPATSHDDSAVAQQESQPESGSDGYSLFGEETRLALSSMLLHIRLMSLRERRVFQSRRTAERVDQPDPQQIGPYEETTRRFQDFRAEWADGEKGWNRRKVDRNIRSPERLKQIFVQKYRLEQFQLGGVQTHALRRLIRRIKRDGLTPFLFLLPVVADHRELFRPGDYEASLEHIRKIAEVEDVRLFDFDTRHNLKSESFFDHHHLNNHGALEVSTRFARDALRPLLDQSHVDNDAIN